MFSAGLGRRRFLAGLATLAAAPAAARPDFILVQASTSLENSGFFDHLLPQFTAETGIAVRVVAVGTGQAIRNAANGDGDVLFVHDRGAEEAFVAAGFGTQRYDVMHNDFVLVGPEADPAGIGGGQDAATALAAIAAAGARFASRGDDSGTHKAERRLWSRGAPAGARWYLETGAGMGATLNTAIGMGAYTLTDRATWTRFGNRAGFRILVAGDPRLFNQYGIVPVNPARHPHIRADLVRVFVDWLLSPRGQAAIAGFRVAGEQLFFPNAGGSD